MNSSVRLSCDASQNALGACLLQKGRPIAYASRALTAAEKNYPSIGREAAAIRFACKKYHNYIYGKQLDIETDHKPLETIFKKSIMHAPMRLQQILWDILPYSPMIHFKKGIDILLPDALSRDCKNEHQTDSNEQGEYKINMIFSMDDRTRKHLANLTSDDVELKLLRATVHKGWPNDDNKLPEMITKYSNFKEEIWDNGQLLFKANNRHP